MNTYTCRRCGGRVSVPDHRVPESILRATHDDTCPGKARS